MRGEIGIKIRNITVDNPRYDDLICETTHDLKIEGEDGEILYIVGDNNIIKLLRNALCKYYKDQRKKENKSC